MDYNHLHVALASDQNYAEFVAVVMVSLFDTNHWQDFTTIHLLSNGIDEATIEKLRQHVPVGKGELKVYDIRSLKKDLGIDVPPTISITSYGRLFLPVLVSEDVERVLYLDCDVVVNGSVKDFYGVQLDGHWVAGVRDTLYGESTKTAVGMEPTDDYLNAGVILMNLDAWRKNKVTQLCLDFLMEHDGKVVHHDQGIINGVCNHHKLVVHPKFNVTTTYFSHQYSLLKKHNTPFYTKQEVNEAKGTPAIIHFTEGFFNRPWIDNSLHPLRDVFIHYRKLTQWADVPSRSDQRSIATRITAWSFLNLPYGGYVFLNKMMNLLSHVDFIRRIGHYRIKH
jgi:lipopolysaccharide biosynthesis glycosyltransferase